LAWAVRGCLDWQRLGLGTCQAVEKASIDYKEAMDTLGDFVAECSKQGKTFTASFPHITTGKVEVGIKPVVLDPELLEETDQEIEEEYKKIYTPEEISNIKLEDMMSSASFETIRAEVRPLTRAKTLKEDSLFIREIELKRKDGSTVWTETSCRLLRVPDGKPLGLVGVTRDITQRMKSDEALRRSEAGLARAQRIAHLGNWDWK
jgi:PAS domain S-box-containing protein